MRSFGQTLRNAKKSYPGRRLTTFKSDVAKAFLNLPAHPIWQIRQFVMVDGKLYIIRCLVFSNRASPRIWCAISSLICWIGIYKLEIIGLHVYMDDFFGWEFADQLVFFHGKLQPKRQVQLLILWEFLGCPFDDEKQLAGCPLKIIGFSVDINLGSISLTPDSISSAVSSIGDFLNFPGRNPPLRTWLRLAGHLNWLLNVLPWGRPALSELYRKLQGKTHLKSGVFINSEVRSDLSWFSAVIPSAIGIYFVDTGDWEDSTADMVFWTDASLNGALSFVFAGNGFYYSIARPASGPVVEILFLELTAILSALHHAVSLESPPQKVLLWSDSLDAVEMLNSLRAKESHHNAVLLAIASVILRSGIDLRACHIPGKKNIRADMLSRLLLDDFSAQFPSYRVHRFEPSRELLPARWAKTF